MNNTDVTYVMGQLPLHIEDHNIKKTQNSRHSYRGEAHANIHVLQPPIIINLRFNDKTDCPVQSDDPHIQRWLDENLSVLNCFTKHDWAGDPYRREKPFLTHDELAYLKASNPEAPNTTIFIHGYNVPYGQFGRQIHAYKADGKTDACFPTYQQVAYQAMEFPDPSQYDKSVRLRFANRVATVYRDPQHIKQAFSKVWVQQHIDIQADPNILSQQLVAFETYLAQWDPTDATFNGFGDRNWWLHMEHNLNRAAGFSGFEYHPTPEQATYFRCIHIAWNGDPVDPADYIAVEKMAEITAAPLSWLIMELHNAGITVNIIAHSAGNIVLTKAMHMLGQHDDYQNCIENAFLWQPALPDTVLSPQAHKLDTSINQNWQTQHAYKAAKSIHVLFSNNDNILGPLPVNVQTEKKQSHLREKKLDTPINAYAALAVDIIDYIGADTGVPNVMQSLYRVAHYFSMPLTVLFDRPDARQRCYQRWYQHRKDLHHDWRIPSDFAKAVKLMRSGHKTIFKQVAFMFSAYQAARAHATLEFLHDSKHHSILKYISQDLGGENGAYLQSILSKEAATFRVNKRYQGYDDQVEVLLKRMGKYLGCDYIYQVYDLLRTDPKHITDMLSHGAINGLRQLVSIEANIIKLEHKMLHSDTAQISDLVYLLSTLEKHMIGDVKHPELLNEFHQSSEEIATLVMMVMMHTEEEIRPAMGYSGVFLGEGDEVILGKKILPFDQTKILFSHGGMKIPSKDLFEDVYKKVIVGAKSMLFGGLK